MDFPHPRSLIVIVIFIFPGAISPPLFLASCDNIYTIGTTQTTQTAGMIPANRKP